MAVHAKTKFMLKQDHMSVLQERERESLISSQVFQIVYANNHDEIVIW